MNEEQAKKIELCLIPLKNLLIEVDRLPAPNDPSYYQSLGRIREQSALCRSELHRQGLYDYALTPRKK